MKLTNNQKVVLVYLLTMLNLMVLIVVVLSYDNYRYKQYYNTVTHIEQSGLFNLNNNFVLTVSILVSVVLSLVSLHFIINQFRDKKIKMTELKKMNQNKDRFISILGHDLKGPAIHLYSLSELLMQQEDVRKNGEVNKLISMMHYSAKKHYDLLTNLLDWSVLKSGKIEMKQEPCDIHGIINENFALLELRALEKNISLINQVYNEEVYSDCNFLNTLLRNLLSNAIKFSKSNGTITVFASRCDRNFMISVKDTGVGMSKEVRDSLFNIDKRKSARGTKGEEGTGIGLLICKEFVERNGGELYVESEEGKGTTFTFSIPDIRPIEEPSKAKGIEYRLTRFANSKFKGFSSCL